MFSHLLWTSKSVNTFIWSKSLLSSLLISLLNKVTTESISIFHNDTHWWVESMGNFDDHRTIIRWIIHQFFKIFLEIVSQYLLIISISRVKSIYRFNELMQSWLGDNEMKLMLFLTLLTVDIGENFKWVELRKISPWAITHQMGSVLDMFLRILLPNLYTETREVWD